MAVLNLRELKEEFLVFLRNQDIISTTVRGVTTDTDDTFSGDDSTVDFLINRTDVKNIRSISIGATPQTFGNDYLVDYYYNDSGTRKCKITFTSAPATGTDNITLSYDHGPDKIWGDHARNDLDISSYPRVFFEIISMSSEEPVISGGLTRTDIVISVTVQDDDEGNVDTIINSIRSAVINNKKGLYNVPFMHPISAGPMLVSPNKKDKIVQRSIDIRMPFNFED